MLLHSGATSCTELCQCSLNAYVIAHTLRPQQRQLPANSNHQSPQQLLVGERYSSALRFLVGSYQRFCAVRYTKRGWKINVALQEASVHQKLSLQWGNTTWAKVIVQLVVLMAVSAKFYQQHLEQQSKAGKKWQPPQLSLGCKGYTTIFFSKLPLFVDFLSIPPLLLEFLAPCSLLSISNPPVKNLFLSSAP